MLLNSVILGLREVLEAAMVVSLFMAFTTVSQQARSFLLKAILLGLIAGGAYAYFLPEISNWLEGVGQEITNTIIHIGIYVFLMGFLWLISRDIVLPNRLVKGMMMAAIILAISRESAEIMLYISGFGSALPICRSQIHLRAGCDCREQHDVSGHSVSYSSRLVSLNRTRLGQLSYYQ